MSSPKPKAEAKRRGTAKPKAKAKPKAAAKPARARSKPSPAAPHAGPGAAAEAALRAFALTFPEAHEEFPWGDRALKVGKKVFAFMGTHDGGFAMSTKLAQSVAMALTLPFASPTRYGLDKAGWVTAEFGARETPPLAMMRAWIEESYRAIAPKTLVARLDAASGPARAR
jgi:predicted DNA-binding protein (MmcQ/YjbR family)